MSPCFLLLLPIFILFQNLIHEGSHVIIPLFKGCKVSLKPYPHVEDGRFKFASCSWECSHSFSVWERRLVFLSPRISNLFFIVILSILDIRHPITGILLICNAVDFCYNTLGSLFPSKCYLDAWRSVQPIEESKKKIVTIISCIVAFTVLSWVISRILWMM